MVWKSFRLPCCGLGAFALIYLILPVSLYAGASSAALPQISPFGGQYTSAKVVTITDATPSAVIHFTTDGSTPTAASQAYTAPFTVSRSTTVEAIAIASGYGASPVATITYNVQIPTLVPQISPF